MPVLAPSKASQASTALEGLLDVDGHEFTPSHLWGDVFGDSCSKLADIAEPMLKQVGDNDIYNPSVSVDDREMTAENVWTIRGVKAPGAFDWKRRLQALDIMGIHRQLVFPTTANLAMMLYSDGHSGFSVGFKRELPASELRALGEACLDEYNDWAARTTAIDPDRLRMVSWIKPTTSVGHLIEQTQELVRKGIRAVQLSSGTPPAGLSPAHPDLDPFWDFLASNDIVCTIHVGGEQGFLRTGDWAKAPAFAPGKVLSTELGLEPYSFATLHLCPSNWLTTMVLGGVFERHPNLRFGAIELGSSWFGPLADGLDMWARDVYATRLAPFISLLPSEYFARNVRVCPFNQFERVERQITQYPHLADCYCYSTDYPHIEGGKNSKSLTLERVATLGPDVVEKFFVKNGELLLPD